jgi:hypothetical protein
MKKSIYICIFFVSLFFAACNEKITDALTDHQAPDTHLSLMPDNEISQQASKVSLHWWGDSPDGLVIGYYISWNDKDWSFTTKNDSSIAFPLKGADTSYAFQVVAVNGYGNGKWDESILYKPGGENSKSMTYSLGAEPYVDANNNGKYDEGEKFTDIGQIDPSPAYLKLPLKNSAPVISFAKDKADKTVELPDTTFTVASIGWDASDLDGDETIVKYYIALNDTMQKIEIPGTTRFITLKADLSGNGNTADCFVYIGGSVTTPYSKKLTNLKLNGENKFYIYAVDMAGATSKKISLPEADNKKWFVKKPKGDILIIDDYGTVDNSAKFYSKILDSLGLNGKYDNLEFKNNVPHYITPMLIETMKLFKAVIWYSDNNPSIEIAQTSVRAYTQYGGKILMSMGFPPEIDQISGGLNDFLPIESISSDNTLIKKIKPNTVIEPSTTAMLSHYPLLKVDSENFIAYVRTYGLSIGATALYNLTTTSGTACIGFKNYSSNLVFLGLPLHRCNGAGTAKQFLNKVLSEEFKLY